jgi:hypothetical protein
MPTNDEETKQEVRNEYRRDPFEEDPPIAIKGGSFHVESEPWLMPTPFHAGRRKIHYDSDSKFTVSHIKVFDGTKTMEFDLSGDWEVDFS